MNDDSGSDKVAAHGDADAADNRGVMEVPLKAKWESLVKKEAAQMAVLVEERLSGKELAAAVREWWGTVSEILRMAAGDMQGTPLPGELMHRLLRITADLSNGVHPDVIRDAVREGRIPLWRERRDRAVAAAYVVAARDGRIADTRFRKTIAEAYGLASLRTVNNWAADPILREEFPEVFKMSAQRLSREIATCGARYKAAGPTSQAILRRARDADQ